jgi:hypothetical protein
MANPVSHLKFGNTVYDLAGGGAGGSTIQAVGTIQDNGGTLTINPVGVPIINEIAAGPGTDPKGTMYTVGYEEFGSTTKRELYAKAHYFQYNMLDYCNLSDIKNSTGSDPSVGSTINFIFYVDYDGHTYEVGIECNFAGVSGSKYSLEVNPYGTHTVTDVTPSGGSAQPANWKVATISMQNGQIQSVVSTPQAGCADLGGMNLGVSIEANGQPETYLHSLGHNFELDSAPGVKWDSISSMDYAGVLQPNDNITLNLYFLTTPSNLQKVSIPGTYDSKLSWGGYLYYLDAGRASMYNAQYVGA